MINKLNKTQLVYASAAGAIAAGIFAVAVTIIAEESPGFKASLVSIAGHHWTTKSIFTALVYLLVAKYAYWFTNEHKSKSAVQALAALIWFAILGSVVIFLYFVWHYLR